MKLRVSNSPASTGLEALNIDEDFVEIPRLDLVVDIENPLAEDTAMERSSARRKGIIFFGYVNQQDSDKKLLMNAIFWCRNIR